MCSPQNIIRKVPYDTWKKCMKYIHRNQREAWRISKHLEDIPSKPEQGLQNEATRLLISLSHYTIKTIQVLQKKSLWHNMSNCSVAEDTYFLFCFVFFSPVSSRNLKHLKSHSGYHEKDQIRTVSIVHCPKKRLSLLIPSIKYLYMQHTLWNVFCDLF